MRVHHLNCGAECPFGGALTDGRSKGPLRHLVCHCLLVRPERACSLRLRLYQNTMEVDRRARLANQARLRELSRAKAAGVKLVCAHNVVEFEACAQGRPL